MGNKIIKCCCVDSNAESESDNTERKAKFDLNNMNKVELPEKIPELKVFSCVNIGCYCIIERIIDGDTMDCILKIPYSELERNSMIYINNSSNNNSKFVYFKFKCRLFGIDAAEKNTIQGQIAILLISNILSLNKQYFCRLFGNDKYGRQLISIYDKNKDISERLLDFQHSKYGNVYCKYDGKTKNEFVDLPKYKMRKGQLIVKNTVFIPQL